MLKNSQLEEKMDELIENSNMIDEISYTPNNIPLKKNVKRNDYKILDNKLNNLHKIRDNYMTYTQYIKNLIKKERKERYNNN